MHDNIIHLLLNITNWGKLRARVCKGGGGRPDMVPAGNNNMDLSDKPRLLSDCCNVPQALQKMAA